MNAILDAIAAEWPGALAGPLGSAPGFALSARQRDAVVGAGEAGGAFLHRARKTDVAKLTTAQWDEFIEVIVRGYFERLAVNFALVEAPEAEPVGE